MRLVKKIKDTIKDNRDELIFIAIFAALCIALIVFAFWLYLKMRDNDYVAIGVSAAIGAILSALVTRILLIHQSRNDNERADKQHLYQSKLQRDSLINTEKLKIYQDFMETLNRVLKDGTVTKEEALKLKFKVSLMAMHTKPERVNEISKFFKQLLQGGEEKNKEEKNKNQLKLNFSPEQIEIEYLLKIVEQLRQEIYDNSKQERETAAAFQETIDNFKAIDDSFTEERKDVADSDGNIKDMANIIAGKKGWEDKHDEQHPICLGKEESLVMVESEDDGNWYYLVRCPRYTAEVRREFYKHLRRTYGGSYQTNGAGWWLYFGEEYKTMSRTEFDKALAEQDDFRAAVYGRINSLVGLVDKFNVLALEVQTQLKLSEDKWKPFLYLDETEKRGHCLAMEVYERIDERRPFIDFWMNNDGSYSVVLSLRKGEDHLKEYLGSIGLNLDDQHCGEDSRWFEDFKNRDAAINCALDLIGKVERALPNAAS